MTENELLISYIEDKIRQTEEQYRITSTGFLSPQEKSQAALCCRRNGARHIFCGGYPDAERTVLLLLPDYIENPELFVPEETGNPLCLLRCTAPQGARALTHRDYLGSLLALGIKRDVIGDILVGKGGADIIILKSIAPFLAENYTKAGSVPLSCKAATIGELAAPEPHIEEMRESVASVRLDNMLDAAFGISRHRGGKRHLARPCICQRHRSIKAGCASCAGRQARPARPRKSRVPGNLRDDAQGQALHLIERYI